MLGLGVMTKNFRGEITHIEWGISGYGLEHLNFFFGALFLPSGCNHKELRMFGSALTI